MTRFFRVKCSATALTAANGNYDWLEITAADDKPILLWGWILSQKSLVGDSSEVNLLFNVLRGTSGYTSGSGGISPSVNQGSEVDQAISSGFTSEGFNPTVAVAGSGAIRELDEFHWNCRNNPYEFWYPSREWCPIAKQAEAIIVRMNDTLPSTVTCSATFFIEEGS